jgi:hypothetical protein
MTRQTDPPTLCSVACMQHDNSTHLRGYPALALTNPMASTLHTQFQTRFDFLRSVHNEQQTTPITDPLHYKQAQNNLNPRSTHR